MAGQAKYLFDQDFAPDAKSAEKVMAPAELAIMLAEAESKGYRDGFAAAGRGSSRRSVQPSGRLHSARCCRAQQNDRFVSCRVNDPCGLSATMTRSLSP